MKKKLITLVLSCLLVTIFFAVTAFAGQAQTQDKKTIENLAKSFIAYKQAFHKFPQDKINNFNLDDSTIQNTINIQANELQKYTKKDTDFYNKQHKFIEDSFKTQQHSDIRSFGGNATDINITSTNIQENSAHIDLTFIGHATFGQWQKDHWQKVTPSNSIIEHFDFAKDSSGKWFITNEKWEFAPGSEP
jgi:hypothetical protein